MADSARYDVVVIGASAGGPDALLTLLGGLRSALPVPMLIAVHLGPAVSRLDVVLGRVSPMPVEWVTDGVAPRPGRIYLCPGRSFVRLEPDGTCTVTPSPASSLGMVDQLFESAAGSLGERVLAVVLTGAGRDGAAGARAVKLAGGTVLAQDEATAVAFGMSSAVVDGGDADLVLPLGELAEVLGQVVGRGRPLPTRARRAVEAMFAAGGAAGRSMAATDWAATPLGGVETWSPALRSMLSMVLSHALPMNLLWGPQRIQLFNDACIGLSAGFDPGDLARPVAETWGEAAAELEPMLREVERTGGARLARDQPFVSRRGDRPGEGFVTFCYSPVRDDDGIVAVLGTGLDTTSRVLADRRLAILHRLAALRIGDTTTEADACLEAVAVLAQDPHDVPFALLYLLDPAGSATLSGATGLAGSSAAAVRSLALAQASPWPVHATMSRGEPRVVDDLQARFPGLAAGPWPEPPETALILPIAAGRHGDGPGAVLIAGLSSRAAFDPDYQRFFDLVGEQIGATLNAARGRRDTHQRIDERAELSRARTEFYADVSHDFRTPLTLMLLPLEELIDEPGRGALADPARLAHRHGVRLLRLVDSMLTFAEGARARPAVQEIDDLAALTAETAGVFRAVIQRAGLELTVDCPPLGRVVELDPDMWETVILNLVSNALKHTFVGGVTVRLSARAHYVELVVADTGTGVPEDEIPHLFTRFRRGRDGRARSDEGAGVGLATVQRLVRQHRGSIRVRSRPGDGTTFTVWLPYVQQPSGGATAGTGTGADPRSRQAFADEAERWLAEAAGPATVPAGPRTTVLVVDGDAGRRRYLHELLDDRYEVRTAAGGADASRVLAAHDDPPGLVLTGPARPGEDGLELLRQLRTDPALRATPVVLLATPADPEITMRALAAGAHDYVVMPFTARELIARIESQLALARLRRPG